MCRPPAVKFSMAILMLSLLAACKEPPRVELPPKPVKALTIGQVSLLSERAFPGRAEAVQEATLSFRVSGQMEKRPVDVGDRIIRGDVIAQLDLKDLTNARDAVRAQLAEAEAAAEKTQADYRRVKDVQQADAGAISALAMDRAKAAAAITNAAVDSARAALQIAADRLDYAVLRAPFSGEIVATYVEAFESVILKQPIVRLLNRSAIEFRVDIPEGLIGYVGLIESSVVRFDIRPTVNLAATVKEIGREVSIGTRTYPMTLLLATTDEFDILPGMAGNAYIQAKLPETAMQAGIEIPAAALFSQGDNLTSYVWTVIDSKLVRTPVMVGLPGDYGIRVKSGLKMGDTVVVAGVQSLTEGQSVRVLNTADSRGGL